MAILQSAQAYNQQALQAGTAASEIAERRYEANKELKSARRQSQLSGAASGAMVGNSIVPGWGAVIGAGVGLLAGSLV